MNKIKTKPIQSGKRNMRCLQQYINETKNKMKLNEIVKPNAIDKIYS